MHTGGPWDEALAYVQGLNDTDYLGYDDWRLPTRNELQSLVDYSLYMPATTFPNTGEAPYFDFTPWSSTADAYDTLGAWVLYFYDGYMGGDGKDNYHGVRAVRSGPCRSNGDWCIDNSDCADGFECTEGAGALTPALCEPVAVDNPPAITAGPFLAASNWPVLPTSQATPCILTPTTAFCGPSAMIMPHVRVERARTLPSTRQWATVLDTYRCYCQCSQGVCLRNAAGREPAECNDLCLPVFGDRLRFTDNAVGCVLFPGSGNGCPAGNHWPVSGRSVAGIADLIIKAFVLDENVKCCGRSAMIMPFAPVCARTVRGTAR